MASNGNTIRLHRILQAPPERVYRAFTDPDALIRWCPPYGFTGKVDEFDGRVGGSYHMAFINFGTGSTHAFRCTFTEMVPYTRICYIDRFDDPNLPGEMKCEVELRPVSCGTELTIVQSGLPDAIPLETCYLGWQESLEQLARLVTPEIPDGPG